MAGGRRPIPSLLALAAISVGGSARAAPMDPARVAQDVAVGGSEAVTMRPATHPRDGVEIVHLHLDGAATSDAEGEALVAGSQATVTTWLTRVVAPVPITDDDAVFGGLTYEATTIDIAGTSGARLRPLFELKTTFGLDAHFADIWHLTALVTPGFFGDAGTLRGDDVQVAGAVALDRRFGDEVTLGLGVAYSSSFDTPLPLPTLLLELDHDWLEVDAVIPSNASIDVTPHERVTFGVRGGIEGWSWRVDTPPPALVDPLGAPRMQRVDLDARVVTLGPTLAVRLVGPLVLDLRGGLAFARKLELVDPDDVDHLTRIDLAPAAYVRGGLGVRL